MNNNINEARPLEGADILTINENEYISRQLFSKRGTQFYDIIYFKNKVKYNLGRYNKEIKSINVGYNNNKILLYYFENKDGKLKIVDILGIYDTKDDMFLMVTKEEALKLYDRNADLENLKNKDEFLIRNDINKRKKIR